MQTTNTPKTTAARAENRIDHLFRTVCLIMGNCSQAEEITKAVVVGSNGSRFDPALLEADNGVSLYHKLHGVLRKRTGELPAEWSSPPKDANTYESPDTEWPLSSETNDTLEFSIDSLMGSQVCDALRLLPWNMRLPVVLRISEGFSYRQIASVLNIDTNSAKRLVQRGRRILSDRLMTILNGYELNVPQTSST